MRIALADQISEWTTTRAKGSHLGSARVPHLSGQRDDTAGRAMGSGATRSDAGQADDLRVAVGHVGAGEGKEVGVIPGPAGSVELETHRPDGEDLLAEHGPFIVCDEPHLGARQLGRRHLADVDSDGSPAGKIIVTASQLAAIDINSGRADRLACAAG